MLREQTSSNRDTRSHLSSLQSYKKEQRKGQYPHIWKTAFCLDKDVRFTRTPEIELQRRRLLATQYVEANPASKIKKPTTRHKQQKKIRKKSESSIQDLAALNDVSDMAIWEWMT